MTDMPKKVKPSELVPFSTGPGYLMREAHKAMSRPLAAELVAQGIAFKQYYYLRSLFEQDGISQTLWNATASSCAKRIRAIGARRKSF
jgi:hypothetical protein